MPGKKQLAAMLAIGAAATVIAACGSSDTPKTLSQEEANVLKVKLAAVQTAEDTGKCVAIKAAAGDFVAAVNALPETAGTQVKTDLRDAGLHIEDLANDPTQCQQPSGASGFTGADTTSTTTSSAIPTATTPSTTETTTSTTTTSSTPEPPPSGGDGGAGTPPGQTGGGPPGQTGGGTGTGGTGTGGGGGTG